MTITYPRIESAFCSDQPTKHGQALTHQQMHHPLTFGEKQSTTNHNHRSPMSFTIEWMRTESTLAGRNVSFVMNTAGIQIALLCWSRRHLTWLRTGNRSRRVSPVERIPLIKAMLQKDLQKSKR
jgi:hypothetical protein